jgi:hypothetical protein
MDQGGGKRRSLILIQRAEELPIVSDEAGCDAITNYFILVTLPPSPVGSFVVPLGLTGERFGLVPNPLRNHAVPHSVLAQWRLPVAAWVLAALVTLISLTLSLTHKNTMHINTADHVGQASVVALLARLAGVLAQRS